jgi:hypothetical protein
MFQPLLNLRLLILDSCNQLDDAERVSTASAWVDILELEASRLTDDADEWVCTGLGCDAGASSRDQESARKLGLVEGRLSLIVVDQLVAALIRGHLTEAVL